MPPSPDRPRLAPAGARAEAPLRPPPRPAPAALAPRLADGVRLLGPFRSSGFREPQYLVGHPDGRVLRASRLLYLVAENLDGRRQLDQVAARVTYCLRRHVTADNVAFLVANRLSPLGLVHGGPGPAYARQAAAPLLALRLRGILVPRAVVRALATCLRPLFLPPVVAAVTAALVGFDGWFLFGHGAGDALRQTLAQPRLVLGACVLLVLSGAFHELGHATGCRYGGAEPGRIGAGLYVVWPAFFTEVTDSYRLGRGGRLRTDLGGVYFNAVFMLALAEVYRVSGFEPLLTVIVVQHVLVAYQFLPFLRLDGYYVVGDLVGVPDLFGLVRPILRSFLPGRPTVPAVAELTVAARVVVTAWVVSTTVLLLGTLALVARHGPTLAVVHWRSLERAAGELGRRAGGGDATGAAVAALHLATAGLPLVGVASLGLNLCRRLRGPAPPGATPAPAPAALAPAAPAPAGASAATARATVRRTTEPAEPSQPRTRSHLGAGGPSPRRGPRWVGDGRRERLPVSACVGWSASAAPRPAATPCPPSGRPRPGRRPGGSGGAPPG